MHLSLNSYQVQQQTTHKNLTQKQLCSWKQKVTMRSAMEFNETDFTFTSTQTLLCQTAVPNPHWLLTMDIS